MLVKCNSYHKLKHYIDSGRLIANNKTMNDVIRLMLQFNVIDLEIITQISKLGSYPCNDQKKGNTLSNTIKYLINNNNKHNDKILPLIKLLHRIGATPSNIQNHTRNTFTLGIKLYHVIGDLDFIKYLIDIGAKPDNSEYESCNGGLNSLSHAITTQCINVIKMTIENNATLSTRHSFLHAISTKNIDVIKFVVANTRACEQKVKKVKKIKKLSEQKLTPSTKIYNEYKYNKRNHIEYKYTEYEHNRYFLWPVQRIFETFYLDYILYHIFDQPTTITLMKILMCTGIIISQNIINKISRKNEKTPIEKYIVDFFDLTSTNDTSVSLPLRNELKEQTDELIEISTNNGKIKKELCIHLLCVPDDCINIIHMYAKNDPLFRPIDWLK